MNLLPKTGLLAGLCAGLAACAANPDVQFAEDMTGANVLGVSTGWAFVEADIDLKNGRFPNAGDAPASNGGLPNEGSSSTDLEPVFGAGLKYFHFLSNHISLGGVLEYRKFDPDPTDPLGVGGIDIDDFGTTHLILDGRYWFDPLDNARRLRPYVGLQVGYIPEVKADGTFNGSVPVRLDGSDAWTGGFVVGTSYLMTKSMTFDVALWYEEMLTPTEDTINLPTGAGAPFNTVAYDGELKEKGFYLSVGISWLF